MSKYRVLESISSRIEIVLQLLAHCMRMPRASDIMETASGANWTLYFLSHTSIWSDVFVYRLIKSGGVHNRLTLKSSNILRYCSALPMVSLYSMQLIPIRATEFQTS